MEDKLAFSNLNPYDRMQFFVGNSPEELIGQISQVKSPIKIISMYASGPNHYVWFLSDVKIKKVSKGKQNG